jgi:hypothetical protein
MCDFRLLYNVPEEQGPHVLVNTPRKKIRPPAYQVARDLNP